MSSVRWAICRCGEAHWATPEYRAEQHVCRPAGQRPDGLYLRWTIYGSMMETTRELNRLGVDPAFAPGAEPLELNWVPD